MFSRFLSLSRFRSWFIGKRPPLRKGHSPRSIRLQIEQLETREVPATLTTSGSILTYTATAGVSNNISVTTSGSNFIFTDSAEAITTSISGATGSGTNSVSVAISGNGSSGVILDLGTGDDTIASGGVLLTATGSNAAPIFINHSGAGLTINGPLTTVSKGITLNNTGTGDLAINGALSSANGNITLSSLNNLVANANINAGTGNITISANTDGAGTEGFSQTAGTITSTSTGVSAASISVNTAGGGTGSVTIDSTAISGTLTVNSNGGSVVYAGATALSAGQIGTSNGGSAPTRTLVAKNYVFTATGTGAIGTTSRPIQSSVPSTNSVLLSAGSGGVYWTDWTNPLTLSGAVATGTGSIRVVSANAGGHNLNVTGPVTTGSGSIYLAADDDLTVTAAIGGAGFSGTVYIVANRDLGNGLNLRMNAGASITTSNTTANAVLLEGNTTNGTATGGITLNNITVGNGGKITATTIPTAQPTSNGDITAFDSSVVLNAGATGQVVLIARPYAASGTAIGTSSVPIVVTAGTVTATVTATTSTNGATYITGTGATSFAATISGASGFTGPMVLTTSAGALTISGPTNSVNGGTISLTGAAGVVLNASLGSSTTGAIATTGALSGNGAIVTGTGALTITETVDSTYGGAISGSQGLIKAGNGALTLTGTSNYSGSTAINAGSLLVNGALSATSGVNVAASTTFGGTGTVNGAAAISGTINPGNAGGGTAILNTGNLSFASGGKLVVDLNTTTVQTGYDQVKVTGAINLTNAVLQVNIAPGFQVNDKFTIIKNVSGGAVTGQFTTGTTISALGYDFSIDYANGAGNDVVLTITAISPLLVDVIGGQVSYNSAASINSNVTITNASNVYSIQDTAGAIALTNNAIAAGWTINAGVASGSSVGVTGVTLNLSDGNDTISAIGAGSASLTINGTGTLTVSGAASSTASVAVSGFTSVTDNGSLSGTTGVSIGGANPLTLIGTGSITAGSGNISVNPSNTLSVGGSLNVSASGTTTFASATSGAVTIGSVTISNGGLIFNNASTLTLNGTVNAASSTVTISGVTSVAAGASENLIAATLNVTAPTIGSSGSNLKTQAATIVASSGAGSMFITQSGDVILTATATGAGNINFTNSSGNLTVAGATTATGNINLESAAGVSVNANVNAGSGTIAIIANSAGVGATGFTQGSGTTITTTNTTASAASITVNKSSGGTGDAVLGTITVGSNSGGTLTVNSYRGSILNSDVTALTTSQLGTTNGGAAPTQVIKAANYTFTATGSGSIGTDSVPIQTTNFGTDAVAGGSNFSLNSGSGGVYLTDWGAIDLTLTDASATGAGNIRVVTGNASGHNLYVTGNVSAVTGNIYIAADDNLEIHGATTVIGGAGFSGTVWLQGNRDVSTGGQWVQFDSTASIVTSSIVNQSVALSARTPTTQAVYIDIGGGTTTTAGIVQVGNITVGNGGRVVLNGSNQVTATQSGTVSLADPSNIINVGATGTLEINAILSSTTNADLVGTAAAPIQVAGGNVVVKNQFGNIWITGAATTTFNVSTTVISGQTTAATINLATTAGQAVVGSALAGLNNTAINLTGAAGVVLNATLGSSTTGAVGINGSLSGSGDIVQGTGAITLTQAGNSTYGGGISGNQNVVIVGAGNRAFTGVSGYTGATQINGGTLLVDSPGSISSAATVNTGGTLGGTGTAGTITAVGGTVNPGDAGPGILSATSANFSGSGNLTVQIAGVGTAGTNYDQLALSGALTLGGTSTLTLDLAGLATSGTATNVVTFGSIVGTFSQVVTVNNPNLFVPVVQYGANGITITLTAAASQFRVTTVPDPVTAGNTVNVTVTALDPYNNLAADFAGTVHITSSDLQAVLPADATLANGVGTFIVTMKSAGIRTITATDSLTSSITGTSAGFTVLPASLDHFGVTSTPASVTAGVAFNFTVTALDIYGNTVTSYVGAPAFTSTDSNVQTSLPPGSVNLVSGAGSFSATLDQVGAQTISVADGATTGVSASIQVTPAALARFSISATPADAVAGSPISFTVTAQDAFGNTVTGCAGLVHFTSSDVNAFTSLPADVGLTSGVGNFSATLTTAGTQTISANDGAIAGQSESITITPATLNRFAVSGAPASVVAGTAIPLTVTALDFYGNTVTSFADSVTLTTTDAGTFTSLPASATLSAGVGTFSATLATPGDQTISANYGAFTGSTPTINVAPAALDHFSVTGTPIAAISAGTIFSFTVTAQDVFGNTVPGFAGTIQFSSTDTNGASSLPADSVLTAGVGNFSAALTKAGNQTITVSAGGIQGISAVITVTPLALHHFAVAGTPASTVAGDSFTATVTAKDLYDNTLTGFNGAVTLGTTDTNAGASVPISGTLVSGVLDFSASLAGAGGQRISAIAGSVTGISNIIIVTPAALHHFGVTGTPPSVTAGISFAFTVTALDTYGNTVSGFGSAVTFSSTDTNSATNLPAGGTLVNGTLGFTASLAGAGGQQITASAGSITGLSNVITVTPSSLHHFALSGTPSSVTAGTAFSFAVAAVDQYGNTVVGYNGAVSFTTTDTNSQSSVPAATTLTAGVGNFNATLDQAGSQFINVTNGTITGSSSAIAVTPAGVSSFAVTGTPANSEAGSSFSFTVTARDAFGNTATGFAGLVHFTSTDTNAATSLPADVSLTNGVGSFSATLSGAGSQTIAVASGAFSGVSSLIAVSALGLDHFGVTGTPSTIAAGTPFSFTVTALDVFGNRAVGFAGTVHFTSTDGNATLPVDSTLTNGIGTFSATLTTAGNRSVSVTSASVSASSAGILVTPTSATHFVVSAPTSATAGTAFSFSVTARDAYENTATGYSGTVHFSSTDGNAQTSLPANLGLTNGLGSFTATLASAGAQIITATDTIQSAITGASGSIAVSHAAADRFAVSAPANADAGTSFSFTVTAFDPFGNIDSSFAHAVHFTSSDTNAQTQLPSDTTLTNGMRTFTATLDMAGPQTIRATDAVSGATTGVSGSIVVRAAAPARFIVGAPASAVAGSAVALTLTAVDAFGNTATSYAGTVAFSSSDSRATLPANATLSAGQGTFSGVLVSAGSQTIAATDTNNGTLAGTSGQISVSAAAATRFAITGLPASTPAGASISFTIKAYDLFDNVATGYGGTVHFTSSDSAASLPADTQLVNGVATLSAIFRKAGSQTISATDNAIVGVSDASLVQPLSATSFTLSAPTTTIAGSSFIFNVTARDTFGNVATGYSSSVTFTSADAQAVLPSPVSLTNGVGTFIATLKSAGSQAISAMDGAVTGSSNAIAVSPDAAKSFAVSAPATTTSGTAFNMLITALDLYGNTAAGYAGTVHFTSGDNLATLPTDVTLVNGVRTVSVTLQRSGSQTIIATDTTNGTITGSTSVTVANAGAVLSGFVVSAPSSVNAGTALSFTVTARDQFGDTFVGYTGSVTLTSSDSQVSFPIGIITLTNGVGTFAATLRTAGGQTVSAADTATPSLTGTSGSIAVQPLTATHVVVNGPSTATAGVSFSFTVTALDVYGNTATGYTGAVVFSSTDGQAVLPVASALTNGVGTLTGAFKTKGNQTITATDANASAITGSSSATNVSPASATQITLNAPTGATVGQALNVTATALDPFGNIAVGYLGSAHFTSSDGLATLPADYQFIAGDAGVHTFVGGVVLRSAGSRSITVSDGVRSGQQTVAVAAADTSIGVTAALGVVTTGATTLNASVAGLAGDGIPTSGNVTFSINNGSTVTVVVGSVGANGSASVSANLGVGSYTISASFGGNANFNPSTSSSVAYVVPQRGTTMSVTAVTNVSATTFTANVAPMTGGFGTPTGSVVFYVDGTAIASGVQLDSTGRAVSAPITLLNGSQHNVMAVYSGSTSYNGSNAASVFTIASGGRLSGGTGSTVPVASALPVVVMPHGVNWSMPYSQSSLLIPFFAADPNGGSVAISFSIASQSFTGATPNLNVSLDTSNGNLVIQDNSTSIPFSGQLNIVLAAQNIYGTTNTNITLTFTAPVNYSPTINNSTAGSGVFASQIMAQDSVLNVNFTVNDAEDGPNNLIVSATSSNQTLIPDSNIVSGPTGSSKRTLIIKPAAGSYGTAVITVSVRDGMGVTTSTTFNLLVTTDVSLPASDNFNRTSSPFLGPQWTATLGGFATNGTNSIGVANTGLNIAALNGVSAANVSVQANVSLSSLSGVQISGLVARYQGVGDSNMYLGAIYADGSGTLAATIFRNYNGVWTLLATQSLGAVTMSAQTLRFEVFNDSLKLFVNNSLKVWTNDSAISGAGASMIGLRAYTAGPTGASYASFSANAIAPLPTNLSSSFSDPFAATADSQLGRNWTEHVGNFTVAGNTLVSNDALNLATLNGVSQSNVVVGDSVSALTAGQYAGLVARYSGLGDANMYWAGLGKNADGTGTAYLFRNFNGIWTLLNSKNIGQISGTQTLRFEVINSYLSFFINNQLATFANDSVLTTGTVGVRSTRGVVWTGSPAFSAVTMNSPVSLTPTSLNESFTSSANFGLDWRQNLGNFVLDTVNQTLTSSTGLDVATLNGLSAADVVVSDSVKVSAGQYAGLVARYSGPGDANMYWAGIGNSGRAYTAYLYRNVGGVWTQLASKSLSNSAYNITGSTQALRFEVVGSFLSLFVNGTLAVTGNDSTLKTGSVGVRSTQGAVWTGSPAFSAGAMTAPVSLAGSGFSDAFSNTTDFSATWRQNAGTFVLNAGVLTSTTGLDLSTIYGVSEADVVVTHTVTTLAAGQYAGLVARYSGPGDTNMYWAGLTRNADGTGSAMLYRNVGGVWTLLNIRNIGQISGSQILRFEVINDSLKFFINGVWAVSANDSALKTGSVGLRSTQGVVWSGTSAFNARVHDPLTTPTVSSTTPFTDTFSTGATNGNQLSLNWRENVGNFTLDTTAGTQTLTTNTALAMATLNGVSQADVVVTGSAKTLPLGQWAGLVARYSGLGDTNMYWAGLTRNIDGTGTAVIYRSLGGTWTLLSSRNIGALTGMQNLRFEVVNDSLKFLVNGVWAGSAFDSALTAGSVGVRSTQGTVWSGTPNAFTASVRTPLTAPATPLSFSDNFSTGYNATTNSQDAQGNELGLAWKEQIGAYEVGSSGATGLASLNLATVNVSQNDARLSANVNVPVNQYFGLVARYSGSGDTNMYWGAVGNINGQYTTLIYKNVNGVWSFLGSKTLGSFSGLIEFEVIGSTLTLKTDSVTAITLSDTSLSSGKSGIRSTAGAQAANFTAS